MGGLRKVDVEIPVCEYGAADGGHAYGFFLYAELVDSFGHETVHDAVCAARAVVELSVRQAFRARGYFFHRFNFF